MKERPADTAPRTRADSPDDKEREQPTLKAPPVRIGEGEKNLPRRREWFERRSGSKE
jgi:hypothetical protein